jgi:hypothetical protein
VVIPVFNEEANLHELLRRCVESCTRTGRAFELVLVDDGSTDRCREMNASGDWIAPHLDGLRYFEKPVLGYWINALSILLLGENAFAIRFPSAVAAGLTSLLLFFMVRRSARGHPTGILAGRDLRFPVDGVR